MDDFRVRKILAPIYVKPGQNLKVLGFYEDLLTDLMIAPIYVDGMASEILDALELHRREFGSNSFRRDHDASVATACFEALYHVFLVHEASDQLFDALCSRFGQDPHADASLMHGACVGLFRGVMHGGRNTDDPEFSRYFAFLWRFVSHCNAWSSWQQMDDRTANIFAGLIGRTFSGRDMECVLHFFNATQDSEAVNLSQEQHTGHLAFQLIKILGVAYFKNLNPLAMRDCLRAYGESLQEKSSADDDVKALSDSLHD